MTRGAVRMVLRIDVACAQARGGAAQAVGLAGRHHERHVGRQQAVSTPRALAGTVRHAWAIILGPKCPYR